MKPRSHRNLAVLLARCAAETAGGGAHIAAVSHDASCPGLRFQSMALCQCKPLIRIERIA